MSTYFSILYSFFKPNLDELESKLENLNLPELENFDKFFFILPDEVKEAKEMIQIKWMELFGRELGFSAQNTSAFYHGATVIKTDELFLNFSDLKPDQSLLGKNVWQTNSPPSDPAEAMALLYYTLGKIQQKHNGLLNKFEMSIKEYKNMVFKYFHTKQ